MPALSDLVAALVVVVVAVQTVRAIRAQPDALRVFVDLWRSGAWAKQVYLDFYGLELVLALWMLGHAAQTGSWVSVAVCLLAMPIFGSMAAGAYWLWAV